jgi:hypothetical protein
MPSKKGIVFLQEQMAKGCRCRHLALMSGNFFLKTSKKLPTLELKFLTSRSRLPTLRTGSSI